MIYLAAAVSLAGVLAPSLELRLFFFSLALPLWIYACLQRWGIWRD